MSRPKIVAGNWKMNKTLSEAKQLVQSIIQAFNEFDDVIKIIIPPFPFITSTVELLSGASNIYIGAQNCSTHTSGAYTGEVSATMLQSVGCRYVLVGHSERRQYFSEQASDFKEKLQQAFTNNLTPIYCIGEKLEQRKTNTHFSYVQQQLDDVVKDFSPEQFQKIIIAYEPVWAIGTGETATPHQAQEMHAFIRSHIETVFGRAIAQQLPILYGGSCNAQNAQELFKCADVDGGLIGGASLKAEEFCQISKSF